jgi:hypothetical protein
MQDVIQQYQLANERRADFLREAAERRLAAHVRRSRGPRPSVLARVGQQLLSLGAFLTRRTRTVAAEATAKITPRTAATEGVTGHVPPPARTDSEPVLVFGRADRWMQQHQTASTPIRAESAPLPDHHWSVIRKRGDEHGA